MRVKKYVAPSKTASVFCLFTLALFSSVIPSAAQHEKIYLAPDDHTDYVWTGDEKRYEQAFLGMTDYYLDLTDKTIGNSTNAQSRWNFDGSIWMWAWEKNRSQDQVQRLLSRIRDGHFSMPLNFAVSTYGGMPTEAVIRSMFYSGYVERRYGLRFPMAIAMEDQTIPRGLGSLWAGSGAKYSWRGVCACATRLKPTIMEQRPHEIYWWKGPDGSRILMKWYSVHPVGDAERRIGTYLEADDPFAAVQFVENNAAFHQAYPYDIAGIFGEGGDNLSTTNENFIKAAQELTTKDREVIVSNEEDFFKDFEARYGSSLPEETAGYGNEWDTYSASMAELSSTVRRTVERLHPAEALATLVSLKDPAFYKKDAAARLDAWVGLGLYWEHDWTADSPAIPRADRAEWQRRVANQVTSYVDRLAKDAGDVLGRQIIRHGKRPRYFVFNPLNMVRTDAADLPYQGPQDIHVVDLATGRTVPSQFLIDAAGKPSALRIWASDVPSVGYKVYEVVGGPAKVSPALLRANGSTVENADYRVTVNGGGAITSIVAKKFGDRELVAPVDGRYVNDWGSGTGAVSVTNDGPVSITLRADTTAPLHRVTEITLFRDSDRIEIRNSILENFSDIRTWSFSFNLQSPDVWHEEVGAINHARIEPEGNYAARFSRLDWLTLNHFAAMSGTDGVGITLSNTDDAFMKLGRSDIADGVSHLDTATPQISVLAGGQVDGASLGIAGQGGDSNFLQRFALQAYAHYDAASSMRFALEAQNPLVTGVVTGGAEYPERSFSLLSSSDADVMLWALKPAEDGIEKGVIARFWNLAGHEGSVSVDLQGGLSAAQSGTHLETDFVKARVDAGELRAKIAPWQIKTFRLLPISSQPRDSANSKSGSGQ